MFSPKKVTTSSHTMSDFCKNSQSTQYNIYHSFTGNQFKNEQTYQILLQQLNDNNALSKVSCLLEQHDQTEKFVKLIHALASSKLKLSNISWKAALDMDFLSMCTSTTTMNYDREWLEICQIMYHMFGGGVMNTLCGRAHFSHVTSEKCVKRVFRPYEGKFNFPVPSVPTLKKLDIGYSTDIPVGIIQQSLDLAAERAQLGNSN